jgi:predicted MFS family arabinose efflux permease
MLNRAGPAGFALPIAVWNIAIDLGFGLGGVLFGIAAALTEYATAYWILPGVMAVALVLALVEPSRPAPDVLHSP